MSDLHPIGFRFPGQSLGDGVAPVLQRVNDCRKVIHIPKTPDEPPQDRGRDLPPSRSQHNPLIKRRRRHRSRRRRSIVAPRIESHVAQLPSACHDPPSYYAFFACAIYARRRYQWVVVANVEGGGLAAILCGLVGGFGS